MAEDGFIYEVRYATQSLKVTEFARAIGENHTEGEDKPVPPTFPIIFTTPFLEVLLVDLLKQDRGRVLHGEQEYVYRQPSRIGNRIAEDYEKVGKRGAGSENGCFPAPN
jgi:hypothetical protein